MARGGNARKRRVLKVSFSEFIMKAYTLSAKTRGMDVFERS